MKNKELEDVIDLTIKVKSKDGGIYEVNIPFLECENVNDIITNEENSSNLKIKIDGVAMYAADPLDRKYCARYKQIK